jgi:hypothetical protein
MRLPRLLPALALALLLGGCGGSTPVPPETTSNTPAGSTAAQEPVGAEADGPYGELSPSGVGPVEVGMDEKQVTAIFGKPDDEQEVSFAGPGVDAPQLDWVWKSPDGEEFRLQFQTTDNTVTGYRSCWTTRKTADGFTVGTPVSEIEAKYDDELAESPIGTGSLMLSEGAKGSFPALVFAPDERTGDVVAIEGGLLQPAGD